MIIAYNILTCPSAPALAPVTVSGRKDASVQVLTSKAGKERLQAKLDYHIMKLICVRGLVPNVIDSPEWKSFVTNANPKYDPTSSSKFVEVHIPSEAAKVRVLQLEHLGKRYNLTLTYDGGTTRKPQSVYTVHITTQDRRVFFVAGDEASREHHTAEHIRSVIIEVSDYDH